MALKACLGKRCRAGQINHFVRVTTTNNYLGITSIRVITHFMCLATDIALYMCVYNFPSPFFFFFPPGKNMRSRWWCVSTCPKNRRTAKREAWCPCRACWAVSHTSVTSQHWQEARAGRWACSDITKESYFTYWARLKHCWWGNIWIYQLKSMFRVGVERYLMGVSLRWRKALVKSRGWPDYLLWLLSHVGSHQQTASVRQNLSGDFELAELYSVPTQLWNPSRYRFLSQLTVCCYNKF